MICFPNAKINIGLRVLEKRPDGYHNIESVFFPLQFCDALEVIPGAGKDGFDLNLEGLKIEGDKSNNLCVKAYYLLKEKFELPSMKAGLLKCIPMGAGLGGGSADAAFFLKLINDYCSLHLSTEELKSFASQIGSDCTFFIENKPSLVTGKGDNISPVNLDLSNYYISIVCPNIHVNTQNAYSLITPRKRSDKLDELVLKTDIKDWKNCIQNDFEIPMFKLHPQLAEIKKSMYDKGSVYASMTGSGSAIYGIFEINPDLRNTISDCKIWTGKLNLTHFKNT